MRKRETKQRNNQQMRAWNKTKKEVVIVGVRYYEDFLAKRRQISQKKIPTIIKRGDD